MDATTGSLRYFSRRTLSGSTHSISDSRDSTPDVGIAGNPGDSSDGNSNTGVHGGLYPGHIQTSLFQKVLLTGLSSIAAITDPARDGKQRLLHHPAPLEW